LEADGVNDAFDLEHVTFCKLDVAYLTGMPGLNGLGFIQDGDLAVQVFFLPLELFIYSFNADVSVRRRGGVTDFAKLFVFFLRDEGMVDSAILIH
jgi:hypothetical protein